MIGAVGDYRLGVWVGFVFGSGLVSLIAVALDLRRRDRADMETRRLRALARLYRDGRRP